MFFSGVSVGMGMVGMDDIVSTGRALAEQGYKRVSPHFVPRILTNMAAGLISLKYGFKVRFIILSRQKIWRLFLFSHDMCHRF